MGHQEHILGHSPMFHEGDILCSKYKLKRQFNKGGFSSVWLARDLKAQVDFALKIYDNIEDMEEFRKGFNLVVNLTHSNIFKPLAYDIHEGVPFLVMSYCQHGSATSRIGKMSEDEIWKFAHDVASGLAYLHDKKAIVHQDIKPGNILIDDDGKYMITDFDISTRQRHTVRMTARQVQEMQDYNYGSGTPDYMGPERWPDSETDYIPSSRPIASSDIWSLGATLFELMKGEVPFGETGGAHQRNLCKQLSPQKRKGNAVPEIPGNYSKELKKLVRMCLAKDAWDRPSAKQIADNAPIHKAPILHPCKWKKYVAIGSVAAAIAGSVYIYWPHVIVDPPINPNDSILIARIEEANKIVEEQAEQPAKVKYDNYATAYVEKLIEAAELYHSTDTLKVSHDSIRIKGKELWAVSQNVIDKEYVTLDSLHDFYGDLGAEGAASAFSKRRRDIRIYVSDNIK